jgi:hypothetical protein
MTTHRHNVHWVFFEMHNHQIVTEITAQSLENDKILFSTNSANHRIGDLAEQTQQNFLQMITCSNNTLPSYKFHRNCNCILLDKDNLNFSAIYVLFWVLYLLLNRLFITRYPCSRPQRPMGFWDVEASTLSRQTVGSEMAVRLSALRAGRHLPSQRFLYSFLLEAESTSGP